MSDFDAAAAKKAGYTDGEIADYLGKSRGYDVAGARKAGYSDADVVAHLSAPKATGTAPRVIGQAAQGFNDSVADVLGAPVDGVAWGLRQLGVGRPSPTVGGVVGEQVTGQAPKPPAPFGGSESIKKGIDYVATLPGRVGDAINQGSFKPLADGRTSRFEAEGDAEKFAHGAGEGVGNALSVMVPGAAIANTARAGTVTQGVANALRTQPVMQTVAAATGGGVGEATDSPLAGLAASLAVPVGSAVARRITTPVTNALSPQERRLAAAAATEGIPLTPAQQTGSPGLKMVESTMAKMPGSAGPMQEVRQNQRNAFNSAVLDRAGVTATDASPDTIERAFVSAGQTFDDLARRTTLNADRQFVTDVLRVEDDYGRRLPTDVAPVFRSYMQDLMPVLQASVTGANPQLAGDVYANIRSGIARRIRASSGRPDLQEALGGLQTALDDAVERSTTGALRAEWQDARREYQALMTVDKAMQGGTQADRAAGNIPFGALKTSVKQADPRGYARGRGQLNELARVGDMISDKVPDSGTATRQAIMNPLMWPVMLGGNLAARAYNSGPMQNYLTNHLAGRTDLSAQVGGIAARQGLEEATGGQNALSRKGARR